MNKVVYLDIVAGTAALGRIEIELFYDVTPKTAENFRGLCTGEYGMSRTNKRKLTYKGSKIHKIVENQFIVGGDITLGNGKGGESIYGDHFIDENFQRRHACAGLLSMENKGRDSNNSQFLITLKPCPHLDNKHVVFGQIIKGMNIVFEISKIPTDIQLRPKTNIIIFECGDYDMSKIHLKEDVFKETIDSIIAERKKKEIIKLLGPEELKKMHENDISNNNNNNNNLLNNEISNNEQSLNINKKPLSSSSSSSSSSSDEEDEDDKNLEEEKNRVNELANKFKNKDDKDKFLSQYNLLKSKIKEAKNLNNKAVMEENKKNEFEGANNKKISRQEYINNENLINSKLRLQGINKDKLYLLNSIHRCDNIKDQINKKEKNKTFGWDVFNDEAYYRGHKKRLKNMPFDKELYDSQMKEGVDNNNKIANEERKNLLQADIEKQQEKRALFSRRRTFWEEEQMDYSNERNRNFNKKLERFYGKDSQEIKANLERGTAV